MKSITMERVCEWDAIFGDRVGDFLRDVQLATFFHEDNLVSLSRVAKDLGIPLEDFCSYVWLRAYLRQLREDYDDFPSVEAVAQQFGIKPEALHDYICGQDELACKELGPEWGGEWNSWEDYYRDLQQDAADAMWGE